MNIRLVLVLVSGLMLGMSLLPTAHAEPPAIAQREVDHLLGYIQASGCEFYRNGSWYDSKRAEAHLRNKYDYLAGENLIDVAEDFIEKAASKSSLSGTAYEVRCASGVALASSIWLHAELAHYRRFHYLPPVRVGLP